LIERKESADNFMNPKIKYIYGETFPLKEKGAMAPLPPGVLLRGVNGEIEREEYRQIRQHLSKKFENENRFPTEKV
jgi:hypothetical protein